MRQKEIGLTVIEGIYGRKMPYFGEVKNTDAVANVRWKPHVDSGLNIRIEEMKQEDSLKAITELRAWLIENKVWKDSILLSEVAIKLAAYNAELGSELATLHLTASQQQIQAFKGARKRELTVSDSEIEAKEFSLDARTSYEDAKHVYSSTQSLISALQTHLRTLSNEWSTPNG